MELEKLLAKKQKIAHKKASLEQTEKRVKEVERKIRVKRLIELGTLVSKVGLEDLERDALFGALLEVSKNAADAKIVKKWSEQGALACKKIKESSGQRLIVTFASDPASEVKSFLRNNRFKWNAFRKEWYGMGEKGDLEQKLSHAMAHIEIAME